MRKKSKDIEELNLIESFFDEDFYLQKYPDVLHSGMSAVDHFILHGLGELRSISNHVDLRHISTVFLNVDEDQIDQNSLTDILSLPLGDSLYSPSPLICPKWMRVNGQFEFSNFKDLLRCEVRAGKSVTTHPALRPFVSDRKISIEEIAHTIATSALNELSILDLDEFISEHRDLSPLAGRYGEIFSFAWGTGLVQNRMKYLGTKAPRAMGLDELFISALTILYAREMDVEIRSESISLKQLGDQRIVDFSDRYDCVVAVGKFDYDQPDSIVELSVLSDLGSISGELENEILILPEINDTPYISFNCEFTDWDLLSGAKSISTHRVIYSVNIGGYDDVPIPANLSDCSFVLISDCARKSKNDDWLIVRPAMREADVKRLCLWYKTHPHKLFPEAQYVVWQDSNVDCLPGAEKLLTAHESLSEVATFIHPDRNCIYDEARIIANQGLDQASVVQRAIESLKAEGFPESYGLYETNLLFSYASDFVVRDFFDSWWRRIFLGSRRDQLSFTPAARETGITISGLDGLSSAKNSRYFRKKPHIHSVGRTLS